MEDRDFNLIATADISPCRAVKLDSNDGKGTQGSTNDKCVGISIDGTRQAPGTAADDGLIAKVGENVAVYGPGRQCLMDLGGTVTVGLWLKADSNGKGVAAATTGTTIQEVVARALQAGVSGDRVKVQVWPFTLLPAAS